MNNHLHNNIAQRYKASKLELRPTFPTKMKIEISNYCNHNCIFCGRNQLGRIGGLIDEGFYARIMQEAYDAGVREVGLFINGEPFTSPRLAAFIKIAKDIGYTYVYLTTNGALATPERQDEIFEAGLDSIKFSINAATRKSYEKIHGHDDFDKVMENLRYCNALKNRGSRKFNLFGSFVVTNINAGEVELFKEKYTFLFDDFAFYKARANGLLQENAALSVDGFTRQRSCVLPFNTLNIDYDGSLLACCEDINHKINVADLNEVPLTDAWYGENMTNLRKAHLEGDLGEYVCKECLLGGGGVVEVIE